MQRMTTHFRLKKIMCSFFFLLNGIIIFNVPCLFFGVWPFRLFYLEPVFCSGKEWWVELFVWAMYTTDRCRLRWQWPEFPFQSDPPIFLSSPNQKTLSSQPKVLNWSLKAMNTSAFLKVNALIFCDSITGNVHIFIIFLALSTEN